jgi:hypothetical protein
MDDKEWPVGKGWWKILDDMDVKLKKENPHIGYSQIKEKFGNLRVYTNAFSKRIDKIVSEAELKSSKICEECGKPGKSCDPNGWMLTLCSTCEEKRKR